MSQRPRVVITDFIAGPLEMERRILGEVAEIVALDAASEDELQGKIEDAAAIMMYHTVSITEKTINRLKHCRIIVRCCRRSIRFNPSAPITISATWILTATPSMVSTVN